MKGVKAATKCLNVATWNIAAINNNPFEYWISYDSDPNYTKLMSDVEDFIENPKDRDVAVDTVFTQEMFENLKQSMEHRNWKGLEEVEKEWNDKYSKRKIISQFMKDKDIGKKRLTSMPDRFTNTINDANGHQVYRPTVINMYDEELSSISVWFEKWKTFMFETSVNVKGRGGKVDKKIVCDLLQPIQKAKYPDITEEEEKISVPLQTVLLACFDAILVHMMNSVAHNVWCGIKKLLCEKLNQKKDDRILQIIHDAYSEMDIVFLQEVAAAFIDKSSKIQETFFLVAPEKLDVSRDQNSMILLNKKTFAEKPSQEITSDVLQVLKSLHANSAVPVVDGDLLVIIVKDRDQSEFVLASFHGDTNGLATIPVVSAVSSVVQDKYAEHIFIFGLDANTYEKGDKERQDVKEFADFFISKKLTSCYGDHPSPTNYTTFNARTFLQAQLNKACKSSDKKKGADINPKDFILFSKDQLAATRWWKDNTGSHKYVEDMVFPTIEFPSDHGIVAAVLQSVTPSNL